MVQRAKLTVQASSCQCAQRVQSTAPRSPPRKPNIRLAWKLILSAPLPTKNQVVSKRCRFTRLNNIDVSNKQPLTKVLSILPSSLFFQVFNDGVDNQDALIHVFRPGSSEFRTWKSRTNKFMRWRRRRRWTRMMDMYQYEDDGHSERFVHGIPGPINSRDRFLSYTH